MRAPQDLPDWKEPTSPEEAETQALILWEEIQSIQLQLADPNRLNENKQRLPYDEYLVWQHRAKYALAMKLRVYRRLKQWIKTHRKHTTVGPGESNHVFHLEVLADAVRCLVAQYVDVTLDQFGTEAQREAYADVRTALQILEVSKSATAQEIS